MISLESFKRIYVVDFEFATNENLLPKVVCMVAKELRTGETIKLSGGGLQCEPPFLKDKNSLYVAFFASAEIACHLSLGWQFPDNIIDLYAEFRTLTNQKIIPYGNSLLGALAYFGISSMGVDYKNNMRALITGKAQHTEQELNEIIHYCHEDVKATTDLYNKISPRIENVHHALLRGEYMQCVARMEHTGIPLDSAFFEKFNLGYADIKEQLIERIDAQYNVYEDGVFKVALFEKYLVERDIPWTRSEKGNLLLDKDTFKEMARSYPELNDLKELRYTVAQANFNKILVANDSRNRVPLFPFQSKTGRNQPSTSRFIYGPATWVRSAIKPSKGRAIAYIDWSQQEFGIAAALSRDQNMIESYNSGDPYLSFAKLAGAVPLDATKKSHPTERELYKACVLAVQYGMGEESLASRINKSVAHASDLLNKHRNVFNTFWQWSDRCLETAYLTGKLTTVFGWNIFLGSNPNPRSLRNFPMQANGAEILRLAIVMAFEKGIKVCAPIHDAILIESEIENIERDVMITQECMEEASSIILNEFKLKSDVEIYRYPDRYKDKRGVKMWDHINELLHP